MKLEKPKPKHEMLALERAANAAIENNASDDAVERRALNGAAKMVIALQRGLLRGQESKLNEGGGGGGERKGVGVGFAFEARCVLESFFLFFLSLFFFLFSFFFFLFFLAVVLGRPFFVSQSCALSEALFPTSCS